MRKFCRAAPVADASQPGGAVEDLAHALQGAPLGLGDVVHLGKDEDASIDQVFLEHAARIVHAQGKVEGAEVALEEAKEGTEHAPRRGVVASRQKDAFPQLWALLQQGVDLLGAGGADEGAHQLLHHAQHGLWRLLATEGILRRVVGGVGGQQHQADAVGQLKLLQARRRQPSKAFVCLAAQAGPDQPGRQAQRRVVEHAAVDEQAVQGLAWTAAGAGVAVGQAVAQGLRRKRQGEGAGGQHEIPRRGEGYGAGRVLRQGRLFQAVVRVDVVGQTWRLAGAAADDAQGELLPRCVAGPGATGPGAPSGAPGAWC